MYENQEDWMHRINAGVTQQRFQNDILEIQKAGAIAEARTAAVENVRLNSASIREQQREQREERRRAQFQELEITSDGKVQVTTRNLSIPSHPREVTNLQSPHICILHCQGCHEETIFQMTYQVNGTTKTVFLLPNHIGSGSYLIRKLSSTGVCFKATRQMEKRIAEQLIHKLLEHPEHLLVPFEEGWYIDENGEYGFAGEGELTWKKAKKSSQ